MVPRRYEVEWWDKNVLFTKMDYTDPKDFFASATEFWTYHNKEELVLKNHWTVSKMKKIKETCESIFILKPLKEEKVRHSKQVKPNINRIHIPAMTLEDIEKEEREKNKVREWCKSHWEKVKADYHYDDVDSMMLLTQMYPNYERPE